MKRLVLALAALACVHIAAAHSAVLPATPATVQAVIAKAQAGDTVQLAPGAYGRIAIAGRALPLTLDASARDAQGLGVTVAYLTVYGGVAPDLIGGTWGPTTYNVITFSGTSGGGLHHVTVTGAGTGGAALNNVVGAVIEDSDFVNSVGDGIDCVSCRDVIIDHNSFAGGIPSTNHLDAIQFWNVAGQPATARIRITRNAIMGPTGGVDMFASADGASDVAITDNRYAGASSWAAGKWMNCLRCTMVRNIAYTVNTLPPTFAPPSWYLNGALAAGNINGMKPGGPTLAVP